MTTRNRPNYSLFPLELAGSVTPLGANFFSTANLAAFGTTIVDPILNLGGLLIRTAQLANQGGPVGLFAGLWVPTSFVSNPPVIVNNGMPGLAFLPRDVFLAPRQGLYLWADLPGPTVFLTYDLW